MRKLVLCGTEKRVKSESRNERGAASFTSLVLLGHKAIRSIGAICTALLSIQGNPNHIHCRKYNLMKKR